MWNVQNKYKKILLKIFLLPQFLKSIFQWIITGRQTRSIEEIIRIYDDVCTRCEHFSNDECGICLCGIKRETKIFNKLALKNMICPDEPPRWE